MVVRYKQQAKGKFLYGVFNIYYMSLVTRKTLKVIFTMLLEISESKAANLIFRTYSALLFLFLSAVVLKILLQIHAKISAFLVHDLFIMLSVKLFYLKY